MNAVLTRGAAERPTAETLRRLVDALPVAVVRLDGTGRIADYNATAPAMLGDLLAGERWRDVIDRAFAAPCPATDDAVALADGRRVEVTTGPLGDGPGPGQFVMIRDVTDVRAVQAARERAKRLLSIGETAAALAHQVRTPLASALLYVSRIERDAIDDGARQRCAKVRSCIDHVNRLVRDMLAFSGGADVGTEAFTVADLFDDLRRLSASLFDDARCRIELIDDSAGARVGGSRDALLTVLQNLLDNAIRAGTAQRGVHGNVRLLARRTDAARGPDAVEITVSDDGAGIPAPVRERVLEPFFTTRARGTGLGLSVARAIVQAHRGVLWIESESGAGTTVGIRLPASIDGAHADVHADAAAGEAGRRAP